MIRKFNEKSRIELELLSAEDLRVAYQELLAHHVEETTALWEKLKDLRSRLESGKSQP